ncbi:superoxide dismutase family protein [Saccharopolyspora cebuensis]|uniref:Superoxide dismutase family protein n=1 Tax=Saccharopolyspora cebuensis TaxID=418759 RepID=A0ABV4CT30_9PSEU
MNGDGKDGQLMHFQRTRLVTALAGACTAGLLLSGCAGGDDERTEPAPADQNPPAGQQQQPEGQEPGGQEVSTGTFEEFAPDRDAITYDPQAVPPGSTAKITSAPAPDGRTTVTAEVTGLQPDRDYGAHVHVRECGPTGQDAGPHFQQNPDPVQPSVDPAYANPQNEVWLDFRTDAQGNATSSTTGNWAFGERDDAQSFVIHEEHTHTQPGQAGEAGARLACFNADF